MHNLFNAYFFGYSGNELHAYMDRAAKTLRKAHRAVGHDTFALTQMLIMFRPKYKAKQITETYGLHISLDRTFSEAQSFVKNKVRSYGKKKSVSHFDAIREMNKEMFNT